MISRLLPSHVACAETREDDAPPGTLYPEEEALITRAVPRRRREFAAVRACARRVMGELGLPPAPVLPGHRGAPRWPEGIVGSMTHCDGYRAAALARTSDALALGIDAEPHAPLPEGVLETIALPSERGRIARSGTGGEIHWDRLLFSAKESVFKAWNPYTRLELDFTEADISFRRSPGPSPGGTFAARLLRTVPGLPTVFDGNWLVHEGIVVTAIALPAPRPQQP
ncbi:4'-phosphopantetheinyl transferase superfamily protein [Streptomyces sp. AM 4-1-1]|uniref:4'-phosphopantetheinyl transferase family protein n=1 Tax=Streptomyces sp. AM 4-1-1 TaxID=3028710 RepID=UPI0023B93E70|nr:4'-phosphopantetheinyl transferase superfamily protein [Streptomyces sp. AM 4-1-1]WEH37721.1 4'-phosphopantetheinyl transferase superfamily protein [Streptomyces sp. AM 4-1-1]